MINVTLDPYSLSMILKYYFSYEACAALCNYFDEMGITEPVTPGDLVRNFDEIPEYYSDTYEDGEIIAHLNNGNMLVMN